MYTNFFTRSFPTPVPVLLQDISRDRSAIRTNRHSFPKNIMYGSVDYSHNLFGYTEPEHPDVKKWS
jgi:hypothetical protein